MATIADLVIRLSANSTPAEKDMKSFTGKVQRSFGRALIPAVGVLGVLAVAGKKAADAASNLGESQNAVRVVFGKSSKTISDFAKVADKEAGLSMRQLNELVTPIGASMINMGDSADVAAKKSVNLARRAADMASVFNVDVSEALGAIQAGLRGEADPLERFGVGLSDVKVRAQAVAMGLADTAAAVTDADKAQARYALILKETDKLQGDFVNTSGEAANAARVNAAASENLKATYGAGLLPVVKTYQKLLGTVTRFMAENTGVVKIAVAGLVILGTTVLLVNAYLSVMSSRIVTTLIPALIKTTAVQWLLNTAFLGFPVIAIVVALIAVGVAMVVLWKKSETFRDVVNGVFNAVRFAVAEALKLILTYFDSYLAGIELVLRAASKLPVVGDKFKGLADAVGGARDRVQNLKDTIDGIKSKDVTVKVTTVHKTFHKEFRVPGVAGSRAHGGPVRSGLPYLVGEEGPELFTPGASGKIIPNGTPSIAAPLHSMGGGGGDGDIVLELDGEVLARFNRRELTRKGKRNVGVSFA